MDGVIENTSTDMIIMIDKLCKRILGHPEVLGRIMKGFIKEAENLSLEEIMELIKRKKDHEGNYYLQQLNNVSDIPFFFLFFQKSKKITKPSFRN